MIGAVGKRDGFNLWHLELLPVRQCLRRRRAGKLSRFESVRDRIALYARIPSKMPPCPSRQKGSLSTVFKAVQVMAQFFSLIVWLLVNIF